MALGNGNITTRLSEVPNLPVLGLHDKSCAGLPQTRFMKDKVPATAKMKTMPPSCQLQAVPMPADLASSFPHGGADAQRGFQIFRLYRGDTTYVFIHFSLCCVFPFTFKNNDASPATRVCLWTL